MTPRLSIAPMIDWTTTHFRVLMRLIAPKALLYTEMQTVGAIENNPKRALSYHGSEEPLALQLGGSDPKSLSLCAQKAEALGFAEVNLNLGCPSNRVQAGRFGACLMGEPYLVSHCIETMKRAVSIPVTAKTRIGIDHHDSYDFFSKFAKVLVQAGCDKLIVHARKAWLHGLNPKQNRTIPPINYEAVYQLKNELPTVPIILNGNINSLEEVNEHLEKVEGVMLGRLAYNNPYALASIHQQLYPEIAIRSRGEVLTAYLDYALEQEKQGVLRSLLVKPLQQLAHGLPFSKAWKSMLMNTPLSNLQGFFE